MKRLLLLSLSLIPALTALAAESAELPDGFVDLAVAVPGIQLDVRYAGSDNFVGRPIDGYRAQKVYLHSRAAAALGRIQAELAPYGLGLKVFDGYRPQQAVDHFVRWARDLDDTAMKQRYYPAVNKANLFRDGYIAARSGHSRGATVDLTLVDLAGGGELDMGTGWDFFDLRSWPGSGAVSSQQRANRLLLRRLMLGNGFRPLREEWWHFTLDDEPFPDTYFDFPVD